MDGIQKDPYIQLPSAISFANVSLSVGDESMIFSMADVSTNGKSSF